MKISRLKEFPPKSPGAVDWVSFDFTVFLGNRTGVTLSSAVWSSEPTGLTFSSQTDTTTSSEALCTVPTSAREREAYKVKCKATFSDGVVRTACLPMRIVCD